MKRRDILKTIFSGTLGIMLDPASALPARKKPNIVVILADDAGYADFGFRGSQDIPTSNLDRLAAEGVICTQGYVTGSVCCPSRMGLITGRNQQRFGAECNCPKKPTPGFTKKDLGLDLDEATIADLLKASGYRTLALGKWHLGEHSQYHPNKRGFDQFYGFLGGSRSYWPSSAYGLGNARRMLNNNDPLNEEKDLTYLTSDLADKAIEFIDNNVAHPFFIYLAFNAVHTPMQAPDEYIEQFSHIGKKRRRVYAAMMKSMDDNIGRVLDKLEELGLAEDTLVFFLSDNGGAPHNGSSNRPLRGEKGTYWEGGIRVPYLVRWKNHLPAGKKYDYPVSSLDILPTALAAAGSDVDPPKPLDGVNLLPFLSGQNRRAPHQNLFWRLWRVSACRQGKWKLVRVADDPLQKERDLLLPVQLFDIEKDPSERKNLADRYPEVVAELSKKLEEWESQLQVPRWYDGGKWRHWQEVQLKNHRER